MRPTLSWLRCFNHTSGTRGETEPSQRPKCHVEGLYGVGEVCWGRQYERVLGRGRSWKHRNWVGPAVEGSHSPAFVCLRRCTFGPSAAGKRVRRAPCITPTNQTETGATRGAPNTRRGRARGSCTHNPVEVPKSRTDRAASCRLHPGCTPLQQYERRR